MGLDEQADRDVADGRLADDDMQQALLVQDQKAEVPQQAGQASRLHAPLPVGQHGRATLYRPGHRRGALRDEGGRAEL